MKISNSIKIELVPANDFFLNKKVFNWSLKQYEEYGISFSFDFHHAGHINFGGLDTIKIQFFNAEKFLMPQSEELRPIPDGYTIVI